MGLTNRLGALILLAVIPVAYIFAASGIAYWGVGLDGVGVYPGINMMRVYILVCGLTMMVALTTLWRSRRAEKAVHQVD